MSKGEETAPLVSNHNETNGSTDPNTALLNAATEGRTEDALNLIDNFNADINAVNEDNETPLFVAVNKGHLGTTEALLKKGADTTVTNNKGETVIHIAAKEDRREILNVLLQYKCDVERVDKAGHSAIHLVVTRGFMTVLESLCDVGADINKTFESKTPLHLAIKYDQIKLALTLVQKDVALNIEDEDKNVPLHLAASRGLEDADLVKLLVLKDESQMDHKNKNGDTPLHIAAVGGHFKAVEYLVDHGSDRYAKNNEGNTPFHLACRSGYKVTAGKILSNNKMLANTENKEGLLPLHLAVSAGKVKTTKLLLDLYENDHYLWLGFLEKDKEVKPSIMDMALDNGNHGAAMALAESDYWQAFMLKEQIDDWRKTTPMRRLILDMPNVAVKIMDKCLTRNGNKIFLYYELLDDRFSKWNDDTEEAFNDKIITEKNESGTIDKDAEPYVRDICDLKHCHPMTLIADTDNDMLTDHPLVKALLRRKWGLSLKIYTSFLVFYAFYVGLFSAFMINSKAPFSKTLCQSENGTGPYIDERSTTVKVLLGFVCLFAAIGMIIELFQLGLSKFKHYFNIHNLLDWFTYVGPIIVVANVSECGAVTHWQWQLGVISLFVTCFNMLFFMRIIPFLGIYIMMILLMLKNFMQFFTIMFLFILTFSLCFFLLLQNQMPFSSPFFSIMKNWVMMVGEMDFTDTFHSHRESDEEADHMHYELLTWALYVAFLVFLSLIIMNLLTSLAVSGVESLQEDSKHKMMILQMRLSLNVEFALPVWLQHQLNCVVKFQKMKVTRSSHISKLWRAIEQKLFGDLCEQDIVNQCVEVINSQEEADKVPPVNKPLTKKELESVLFTKLKTVKINVREIDLRVTSFDKRMTDMEKMLDKIYEIVSNK